MDDQHGRLLSAAAGAIMMSLSTVVVAAGARPLGLWQSTRDASAQQSESEQLPHKVVGEHVHG